MASSISPASQNLSPGSDAPQNTVARFREVFSTVPTSVSAVTAVDGQEPVGLAVGSFLAVSMDPPMAGFLASPSSTTLPRLRQAGVFCVNVLTVHQQHISQQFATPGGDKFAGLSWRPAPATGSPLLDGVAAWFDCRITEVHEIGDRFLVIGEVADLGAQQGEPPLVFRNRQYTALETAKQVQRP